MQPICLQVEEKMGSAISEEKTVYMKVVSRRENIPDANNNNKTTIIIL